MKNEFLDDTSLIENAMEGSLLTEKFDSTKDDGASFNKVFDSIESNQFENKVHQNEHDKFKDIVSTDESKDVTRIKSGPSIELFNELEIKTKFNKGDNDALFSPKKNNKVVKLGSKC